MSVDTIDMTLKYMDNPRMRVESEYITNLRNEIDNMKNNNDNMSILLSEINQRIVSLLEEVRDIKASQCGLVVNSESQSTAQSSEEADSSAEEMNSDVSSHTLDDCQWYFKNNQIYWAKKAAYESGRPLMITICMTPCTLCSMFSNEVLSRQKFKDMLETYHLYHVYIDDNTLLFRIREQCKKMIKSGFSMTNTPHCVILDVTNFTPAEDETALKTQSKENMIYCNEANFLLTHGYTMRVTRTSEYLSKKDAYKYSTIGHTAYTSWNPLGPIDYVLEDNTEPVKDIFGVNMRHMHVNAEPEMPEARKYSVTDNCNIIQNILVNTGRVVLNNDDTVSIPDDPVHVDPISDIPPETQIEQGNVLIKIRITNMRPGYIYYGFMNNSNIKYLPTVESVSSIDSDGDIVAVKTGYLIFRGKLGDLVTVCGGPSDGVAACIPLTVDHYNGTGFAFLRYNCITETFDYEQFETTNYGDEL